MKKLIVANWKMYLTLSQSVTLTKRISNFQFPISKLELVLCPSFVALEEVAKIVRGTRIKLGAQDVEPERRGAYTGEVGLDDLTSLHVQYVLVGHSERRRMGETDIVVSKKLRAVLASGMRPILCVGEPSRPPTTRTTSNPSLERRGTGAARKYVARQLRAGLRGVSEKDLQRVTVAYEPVWAISGNGGQADTPQDASMMHGYVRSLLAKMRGSKSPATILYGGSVNKNNANDFMNVPEIDGLLIGKASTDIQELRSIVSFL